MNKYDTQGDMCMLCLSFLLICITTTYCVDQAKKPWTILTYIAADNDLNPFAEPNIQQMMRVGSNEDRTILVYLAETKNGKKYGKLLRVGKNQLVEIVCDDNVDSGSRQVCLNACMRAFTAYPADHYALIFWDHGSGCLNMPFADLFKGIAYDQGLDTYLSDIDVIEILRTIVHTTLGGKKIDLLGFDACLMAGVELQAVCSPYVDYYVASEELENGTGWDYAAAFNNITRDGTPKDVAQAWVAAYGKVYGAIADERYTLSAVDLSEMHLLAANVDAIARNLITLLRGQEARSVAAVLQQATMPKLITCFDKPDAPDYIDLDHLYVNLLAQLQAFPKNVATQDILSETIRLLAAGREMIGNIVIANVVGKRRSHACGISVYWAQKMIHPSYSGLAWTSAYPCWQALLQMYLDAVNI